MAQDLAAGAPTEPAADPGKLVSRRWHRVRLLRRAPLPLTAAIVLVLIVVVSVLGPMLFSEAAQRQDLSYRLLEPFDLEHGMSFVLGGDTLGRPMLVQLLVATRTSLIIAVVTVGLSALVGSAIGLFSGYVGGWVDALIMRLSDIIHTLPSLLLAMVILYVLSPSITNLIVVLALTRLPIYMRVARAHALEIRERVFVEASRALGTRPWRIMLSDIRPVVTPTVMTVAMLEVAHVILQAAGLSFLGVGLQRPDVDLGIMVASGREFLSQAWWVTFFPGLLVVVIALAANILSNWLRAVDDPAQSAVFVSSKTLPDEEKGPVNPPKNRRVPRAPDKGRTPRPSAPGTAPVLAVRDLAVDFATDRGRVAAVRGVSFTLRAGESLSILGESGSGKSVTGRSLLGLVDWPGRVRGAIEFDGENLVGWDENRLNAIRGPGISMVFQDSLDSLNPVFTVGSQISELLRVRGGLDRRAARERAVSLLQQVGIPAAEERLKDYPHQFSGGMRQRVCIALAIALRPRILIADEPTTALDVTVQAEILRLIRELQQETGMALIFVTHDLGVARLVATEVAVMYAGKIVERGRIDDIYRRPAHPYTRALLASQPDAARTWADLRPVSGSPPDKAELVPGCAFHPRCPMATDECTGTEPGLRALIEERLSACHHAEEILDAER